MTTLAITFPEVIETPRLVLRPYDVSDAEQLFTLVEHDRDRLVESFPNLSNELLTVSDVESYILNRADDRTNRRLFCYGMWLRSSADLVGQLQVKNIAWNIPSAELSYFVGSSCYRRGFATEAVASVSKVAFNKCRFARIFVRVISSNTESLSLAKKLGFQHEGIHRNDFRCGQGKLHDVHYFAITRGNDEPSK